jgi:CheY-like chemotaxis protein
MPIHKIHLLGLLRAEDSQGRSVILGGSKTQALLAYLALTGSAGTIEEAAMLLTEGDVAEVLSLIGDLRVRLGSSTEAPKRGELGGILADDLSVDALEFERLALTGTMNTSREAAELYADNLLEGFMSGSTAFDEWLSGRRLYYWRQALTVFGRLLAAQIKAGWWENATETASRLLALDPSQEVVHRALMRLQLEQGRPDSARRRYLECADILRRDFGREPSAETERVHEEIKSALERTPAPRELRSPGRPVLVLLVEDDLVTSALVEEILAEAGYAVVAVADGADALIEIGRRAFDLLLLDINIPTLNGLRLFEIMIQKGIDTPAVFITGITGPEVEVRSLEMGAADFLRKPVRREVLLPRLRAILQRRERAADSIQQS